MTAASRAGVAALKYLSRYATPEAGLADAVTGRYAAALVVPAFCEKPGLLDGYRCALLAAPGRVLVIVIVNAAASVADQHWAEHQALIDDLGDSNAIQSTAGVTLSRRQGFDVLVVDRANPAHCLPAGEGVGLARRIGCDIALALYVRGQLESPWLYNTDADATLPDQYFADVCREMPANTAARIQPFWHVPSGEVAVDQATALHELRLRYYVASLRAAGSPYAYHSIGSALVVKADGYATVRGFPKRRAGEDFYLLNKIAKVGGVWRDRGAPIELRSRLSLRTPHGTGAAAVRMVDQASLSPEVFYSPQCFELMGVWLRALSDFAEVPDAAACRTALVRGAGEHAGVLLPALESMGAFAALADAATRVKAGPARLRRLHTWFDAFRSLKLVHALRAKGLASLPFRLALGRAKWAGSLAALGGSVDSLRSQLTQIDEAQPRATDLAFYSG